MREARETNYWLRIIKELEVSDNDKLSVLLQESLEIKNILCSILNKTKEDWFKIYSFNFNLDSYIKIWFNLKI